MEKRMQDEQDEKKKLELKLKEIRMEMKYKKEEQAREKKDREARNKEIEMRLEELEDKLQMVVEEPLRKEVASNISNNALTKRSLRDLPIIIISAWRAGPLGSAQTVTFDYFLANYNNGDPNILKVCGDRPGG